MKITFLGTRGYIDAVTRLHKRHAATLITYRGKRIMIDCGQDWRTKIFTLNPDAIVITHAHPDHAWGLRDGAPCPVYATKESWALMDEYPIEKRIVMHTDKKITICGVIFETFEVIHSLLAPGIGYRITAGKTSIFCVHDLIAIHDRHAALRNIRLYIGDGATITRPMVRRKGKKLFGHTTIRAQLGWCQKEGVPQAIFTHCGSQIVESDGRTMRAKIKRLGKERNVEADIAHDGMEIEI